MLDNVVDPTPPVQEVKNHADQFKTKACTTLIYEQFSELLLSDSTTHDNNFKKDTKFDSKSHRSAYEPEQLPNYGDEASFYIDSSVDIIKAYASHQR